MPDHHKFPLAKYRLLREALASDWRFRFVRSESAARDDLIRIHGETYVDEFIEGRLSPQAMRRIGFPWSPELVARTLASAGGTLLATQTALKHGFGRYSRRRYASCIPQRGSRILRI